MKCPKCMKDENNVIIVGNDHYICTNPDCCNDPDCEHYKKYGNNLGCEKRDICGYKTHFKLLQDTKIRFPYNQIFVNRKLQEFYRKPYLEIKPLKSNI